MTRWRLYHPGFQAQLNARRVALWSTAQDRIRALLPQAVDAIAEDLQSPGARRGEARSPAAQAQWVRRPEPRRHRADRSGDHPGDDADEAAERQEAYKPYRATKEQRAALEDKLLRLANEPPGREADAAVPIDPLSTIPTADA